MKRKTFLSELTAILIVMIVLFSPGMPSAGLNVGLVKAVKKQVSRLDKLSSAKAEQAARLVPSPPNKWIKSFYSPYTHEPEHMEETADKGFIICGTVWIPGDNGNQNGSIFLMKINNAGDFVWEQVYDGGGLEEGGVVIQTADGGYAVCGSSGTAYLFKTDSVGNLQWDKGFPSPGGINCYGLTATMDDGYTMLGGSWLRKTDSTGNKLWEKDFGTGLLEGGMDGVVDGGYVMTGSDDLTGSLLLLKTDGAGNMVWKKDFTAARFGVMVKQTKDGGYIIVGGDNGYMLKTDGIGNKLWDKTVATGAPIYDVYVHTVSPTEDGGYFVAVSSSVGVDTEYSLAIRTDQSGNKIWERIFGGLGYNHAPFGITTSDGGYLLMSTRDHLPGAQHNVVLFKMDSSGNAE